MSNQSQQPRIGLDLSETEKYAPLRGDQKTIYVTTRIRDGNVEFDLTVNGQSGGFQGLWLNRYHQEATLIIDKTFIQNYSGSWPVKVEVVASLDQSEDRKTLTLYDTRTMRADRIALAIDPETLKIPQGDDFSEAHVDRQFYDANDFPLPFDEIIETIEITPPVPGVQLKGVMVRVSSMPHAGTVNVLVSGPDGVAANATLTLVK